MFRDCIATTTLILALGTLSLSIKAESTQILEPVTVSDVVVTATRLPTALENVGSSISIINEEQIKHSGYRYVAQALRKVPGLSVTQLGGSGQVTSVFMRGTNSNHTLLMVDGMELSDPSSVNGAFNYAHLTTVGVEKIEILRGPQSTLFGSEAIGGVINMTTKPGRGVPRLDSWLEIGSHQSMDVGARLSGEVGKFAFAAMAAGYSTDGESVTAERLRAGAASEPDAYENLTGILRLDYHPTPYGQITASARYIETDTDLDPIAEDPNAFEVTQQYFGRVAFRTLLFDGRHETTVALAHSHHDRDNIDRPDERSVTNSNIFDSGDRNKVEWVNDLYLHTDHIFKLGLELESERYTDLQHANFGSGFIISGASKADAVTRALYLQDQFSMFDDLFGTVGIRIDDHDQFKPELTFRFAPVYHFRVSSTRLKGSIGTGFRAPSLFELFGSSFNSFGGIGAGNPNLNPEKSQSWEFGIEQGFNDGQMSLGATYFESEIEDLVVVVFSGLDSNTANLNEAKLRGVEATMTFVPRPAWVLEAAYSYTRAEDKENGLDLLRRPKHKINLQFQAKPSSQATVDVRMVYIGKSTDVTFSTGQTVKRGGYTVVDVSGQHELSSQVRLTLHLENIFDRRYEVADGFRGPGRRGRLGLQTSF